MKTKKQTAIELQSNSMEEKKERIRIKLNEGINLFKIKLALIDEFIETWIKGSDYKFYSENIFNGMYITEVVYHSELLISIRVSVNCLINGDAKLVTIRFFIYFHPGTNNRIDEKKTMEETIKCRNSISEYLEKLNDEQIMLDEYYDEYMQSFDKIGKMRNIRSSIFMQEMPKLY